MAQTRRVYGISGTVANQTRRVYGISGTVTVATVVNAGADLTGIEPFTVITLTGSDNATGTPARIWSQVSGPAATIVQSGQSATVTLPGTLVDSTLTFQYQVNGTSDTMMVGILAVTERAVIGGVEVPLKMVAVSAS